jgi:tetratricopeptide (TPR) repeat protein
MWDYAGGIYVEQKDYKHAEAAFTNALAFVTAKPNPRPADQLNAYNELASFYRRAGGRDREKECLLKAIEFNRLVYQGDSVQEANCWQRLAEIAHDEGDSTEARVLIERAIKLDSSLPQPDTWTLNYMKDEMKGWATK